VTSVRTKFTVVATVLFAVPLAAAAVLLAVFLRDEAMRPDRSPVQIAGRCVQSGVADSAAMQSDPVFGDLPATRGTFGQRCGDQPMLTTTPKRLDSLVLRDLEYRDWYVFAQAFGEDYAVVPDLSLWPLTDPRGIGYFHTTTGKRTHSSQLPSNLRDYDPERFQAIADVQGSLNERLLLISGATIVLIVVVALGTRMLAGFVLRTEPDSPVTGPAGPAGQPGEVDSDLVLLARLDTAASPAEDSFDLAVLVYQETTRRYPPNLTYTVDLGDDPVLIHGVPDLVRRVLAESLDNAEREARSSITVRLRTTPQFAILETIVDSPPGRHHYPPEVVPVRP
jgi:hypothetical protein